MAKAYYGTRISAHMTRTPEGYLIAHDVPLGRTGWQEYKGSELGLDHDNPVQVFRPEEEVFAPEALASLEGKTVTDNHPPEWVSPSNENAYHKGHVQNVRRGTGEFSDTVMGDLHIKDSGLISKVENGQRQISIGYDCLWEPQEDGTYIQRQIRANHTAVVPDGRAGDRIAIRDAAPGRKEERNLNMGTLFKKIFGMGMKEFAKDAKPEELAEAMEYAKKGEEKSEKDDKGKDKAKDAEGATPPAEHVEMLKEIIARLDRLEKGEKAEKHESEDAIDAEIKKIEGEDCHGKDCNKDADPEAESALEERHEKELEGKDAEPTGEVPTLPASERPENPIPGADAAMRTAMLRSMKPIIAAMKDPAEKKKATDALLAAVRIVPSIKKNAYSQIAHPKKAEDAKGADADANYGKQLKEKYHRKNGAK